MSVDTTYTFQSLKVPQGAFICLVKMIDFLSRMLRVWGSCYLEVARDFEEVSAPADLSF